MVTNIGEEELEGTEVPVVWRGRRFRAFIPKLLSERRLDIDGRAAAKCGAAELSMARGAEILPEDYAPLARLLLRAEGIASSYIEGVAAPLVEVVLAENEPLGGRTVASWVSANLAATGRAVAHAAATDRLTIDELCSWHETLMAGSPTSVRHVGCVRQEQGWIGGNSPLEAHLVTPPADRLEELLGDLLEFVNDEVLPPVESAAVAHAQFELIHPFADGNGRIGRVLVSWLLTRRLRLLVPPPVSVRIAADVGGYASGLVQYRFGHTSAWVGWFADAASGAGRAQEELVALVDGLRREWESRLSRRGKVRALRSDAAAWKVLDLLPRNLVLSAPIVAEKLGLTRKAAGDALKTLVEVGVLTPQSPAPSVGPGRPAQLYVSEELLGFAGRRARRR